MSGFLSISVPYTFSWALFLLFVYSDVLVLFYLLFCFLVGDREGVDPDRGETGSRGEGTEREL